LIKAIIKDPKYKITDVGFGYVGMLLAVLLKVDGLNTLETHVLIFYCGSKF